MPKIGMDIKILSIIVLLVCQRQTQGSYVLRSPTDTILEADPSEPIAASASPITQLIDTSDALLVRPKLLFARSRHPRPLGQESLDSSLDGELL